MQSIEEIQKQYKKALVDKDFDKLKEASSEIINWYDRQLNDMKEKEKKLNRSYLKLLRDSMEAAGVETDKPVLSYHDFKEVVYMIKDAKSNKRLNEISNMIENELICKSYQKDELKDILNRYAKAK